MNKNEILEYVRSFLEAYTVECITVFLIMIVVIFACVGFFYSYYRNIKKLIKSNSQINNQRLVFEKRNKCLTEDNENLKNELIKLIEKYDALKSIENELLLKLHKSRDNRGRFLPKNK